MTGSDTGELPDKAMEALNTNIVKLDYSKSVNYKGQQFCIKYLKGDIK
jgi:hypothetical protein